jgi:integrase
MAETMKARFRMFRRKVTYYWEDNETGKQGSLRTKDVHHARRLLHQKNESHEQPALNLALARAYASAHDPRLATRTWQDVMQEMATHGKASTQERCLRACKSGTFDIIRNVHLMATTSEDLLTAIRSGGNFVNQFIRRLHNLALNLGWLLCPIVPKALWPRAISKQRRAITQEEHLKIIAAEKSPERLAFYQLLWETGCSQMDAASLRAEDVDWNTRVLTYYRAKLGNDSTPAHISIGNRLATLLSRLPCKGQLFPALNEQSSKERAAEFRRRCRTVGVAGVSLHSYRHSWAERAKSIGYPQRFAQAALGHKSRAVHEAYARAAVVICPPLEAYENAPPQNLIAIPMTPEIAARLRTKAS